MSKYEHNIVLFTLSKPERTMRPGRILGRMNCTSKWLRNLTLPLPRLSLDAATTVINAHGGSGFASTFKITSKAKNGEDKLYFVKTGAGKDSEVMFAGEHMSLNAIHDAVPDLCPRSYVHGRLSESSGSFLVTEFLDFSYSRSSATGASSGLSLAQKLAKLHSTPAPVPENHTQPMFGFPVSTCCGNTEQDNSYKASWADFYAENRLRGILRSCQKTQGEDPELAELVEQTACTVVPRLLGDGHLKSADGGGNIVPAIVHGDLWSGNHGRGSIGDGGVEEVIFDPSSCWAHNEFEFGIMNMFGGFGGGFWKEYHKLQAKSEPAEEFEDRVQLYELYHHLNHFVMFGGGYRSGAVSIMRSLIKKHGKGG